MIEGTCKNGVHKFLPLVYVTLEEVGIPLGEIGLADTIARAVQVVKRHPGDHPNRVIHSILTVVIEHELAGVEGFTHDDLTIHFRGDQPTKGANGIPHANIIPLFLFDAPVDHAVQVLSHAVVVHGPDRAHDVTGPCSTTHLIVLVACTVGYPVLNISTNIHTVIGETIGRTCRG